MADIPGHEVTRFKGLGEISSGEFGQFIAPDIRLERVDLGSLTPNGITQLLHFLMAENRKVPGRFAYVCDNLIDHKP